MIGRVVVGGVVGWLEVGRFDSHGERLVVIRSIASVTQPPDKAEKQA